MVRKTFMLFVKAILIGTLINVGLEQISGTTISDSHDVQHNEMTLVHPSSGDKAELTSN